MRFLIFDLDGTLIDSAQDYTDATNFVFGHFGLDDVKQITVEHHLGHGLRQFLETMLRPHIPDFDFGQIEELFFAHYEKNCTRTTRFYAGIEKFVAGRHGQCAIVTNKLENQAVKILKALLDVNPFTHILGFDSLPERKPSPMPLLKVLEENQIQPTSALMIGDGTPDILAAQAAGVEVVAVTYGYSAAKDLVELKPNYIAHSPDQLIQIITEIERNEFKND